MQKRTKHHKQLFRRLRWEHLDQAYLRRLILLAKQEDLQGSGLATGLLAAGDVTTNALACDMRSEANLVAGSDLVVCGLPLVSLVLETYGHSCTFEPTTEDGAAISKGARLGTVSGPASTLLQTERVMLNFLQHLSGVATQTALYVAALSQSTTKILDTRKTTPGFRALEKYAVACGGGWNHRMGLFDRVMFKDNHLAAIGTSDSDRLAEIIRSAHTHHPDLAIEVEVDRINQIPPLLKARVDVILLDNLSVTDLVEAVSLIGNRAYTEASGGIILKNLPALSNLGLDFISCGALTHQSVWVDIRIDWRT